MQNKFNARVVWDQGLVSALLCGVCTVCRSQCSSVVESVSVLGSHSNFDHGRRMSSLIAALCFVADMMSAIQFSEKAMSIPLAFFD